MPANKEMITSLKIKAIKIAIKGGSMESHKGMLEDR